LDGKPLTVYHAPVYHAIYLCYIPNGTSPKLAYKSFSKTGYSLVKTIYRQVLVCKPDAPDAAKQINNLNFGVEVANGTSHLIEYNIEYPLLTMSVSVPVT